MLILTLLIYIFLIIIVDPGHVKVYRGRNILWYIIRSESKKINEVQWYIIFLIK